MFRIRPKQSIICLLILFYTQQIAAIEKLGNALKKTLGTVKVIKMKVKVGSDEIDAYYRKKGKRDTYAFVLEGLYEPNCTHTWVVANDSKKATINDIRVVEMSCPHAHPTDVKSFLEQYKGKGPKDLKKLDKEIRTVAKATGSSELTTEAAKTAIIATPILRKQIHSLSKTKKKKKSKKKKG